MSRSVARPVVFGKDFPQPDVPPRLCREIQRCQDALWAWINALVVTLFHANTPDHDLMRINQSFDFAPLVAQCADYYHASGPGTQPTYTVEQLLRAEVVRSYHQSCGDETLATILATSVLERSFVGLPLPGPTPSAATLQRFHEWLSTYHPNLLFDAVLQFLDDEDPEDPATAVHIVDTFGMHTPATPHEPAVVLMRLSAQLMGLWDTHAPVGLHEVLSPFTSELAWWKTAREARSKEKAMRQLGYVVHEAQALLDTIQPHIPHLSAEVGAEAEHLCTLIRKVIADEVTIADDGTVTRRKQKGTFRLSSAVDVDATFRKHGKDPAIFGYNAGILCSSTRIYSASVLTGSARDEDILAPLLTQMEAANRPFPRYVVGDMAFGVGGCRAEAHQLSHGQSEVVAKVAPVGGKDVERLGPEAFTPVWGEDGQVESCRCPNGQTSTRRNENGGRDGVRFRFTAKQCGKCPLWEDCRGKEAKEGAHRDVYISAHYELMQAAKQFNATPEGQRLLGQRWQVEPMVAFLVRYNGCRRARRVGKAAAEFQLKQGSAMRNLQLWIARCRKREAATKQAQKVQRVPIRALAA